MHDISWPTGTYLSGLVRGPLGFAKCMWPRIIKLSFFAMLKQLGTVWARISLGLASQDNASTGNALWDNTSLQLEVRDCTNSAWVRTLILPWQLVPFLLCASLHFVFPTTKFRSHPQLSHLVASKMRLGKLVAGKSCNPDATAPLYKWINLHIEPSYPSSCYILHKNVKMSKKARHFSELG